MKRWILAFVTVIALAAGASTASAQGFGGYGHGRYGHHGGRYCEPYGYGYGGYRGVSPGISFYSSGYRGGYGGVHLSLGGDPRWHDTSHYDYHPGSFRRHGYHHDYVPGHYHLHRSGHHHH